MINPDAGKPNATAVLSVTAEPVITGLNEKFGNLPKYAPEWFIGLNSDTLTTIFACVQIIHNNLPNPDMIKASDLPNLLHKGISDSFKLLRGISDFNLSRLNTENLALWIIMPTAVLGIFEKMAGNTDFTNDVCRRMEIKLLESMSPRGYVVYDKTELAKLATEATTLSFDLLK